MSPFLAAIFRNLLTIAAGKRMLVDSPAFIRGSGFTSTVVDSSHSLLEAWQNRQVQKNLAKILPKSAYYRQRFEGLELNEWRSFPVMNKAEMMQHFSTLNTVGIGKETALAYAYKAETQRDFQPTIGSITVGLSSGTSGAHGLFLASAKEQATWVGVVLAKVLTRSPLVKQRIALFLRANSNLYESLGKSRCEFKFFDLSTDLTSHFATIEQFDPMMIVAPPSVLKLLAQEKSTNSLAIAPRRVFSCAEVLESDDEMFIKKSFDQKVDQIYQATEGFLGVTCAYGTIHLNEDFLVIQKEYLDERRFIPIITDFTRLSQPLIRYRLNDILLERKTNCPCGSIFTAIERIEGRCDDIFYFLDRGTQLPKTVFPDFIRRVVMKAAGDRITNYRVVQRSYNDLDIFLQTSDAEGSLAELSNSIEQELSYWCTQQAMTSPALKIFPWLPLANTIKLRRIEQGMR